MDRNRGLWRRAGAEALAAEVADYDDAPLEQCGACFRPVVRFEFSPGAVWPASG